MGRLLNFAMFYFGWFACVMGAGHGQLWLGRSVVAALLVMHLFLNAAPVQDARLILMIGIFGFAVDTLQASAGLCAFMGLLGHSVQSRIHLRTEVAPPRTALRTSAFARCLTSR